MTYKKSSIRLTANFLSETMEIRDKQQDLLYSTGNYIQYLVTEKTLKKNSQNFLCGSDLLYYL